MVFSFLPNNFCYRGVLISNVGVSGCRSFSLGAVFYFGFLFVDLLLEFCESGTTFSQWEKYHSRMGCRYLFDVSCIM